MYTIGEVSKMFNLPISTIRYYDKEGLFFDLKRISGIRKFSESDLEVIRIIECLKSSGLKIKDIKQFMQWCKDGKSTYLNRRELFYKQKESVEKEIERLNKVLDIIIFKCWYYDMAVKNGEEIDLNKCKMPDDIKKAYERSFND